MTVPWSLPALLADFHAKVEAELRSARTLAHPVDKGDAREAVWIEMLNQYLPRRYEARKGHIVDSQGNFSDQIDIIIHDRQYSPFVFGFKGTEIVPAESVYAVLEAKQSTNAQQIAYARAKAASVRALHRTTMPIQTLDGLRQPKPLHNIIAGLVTLSTDWSTATVEERMHEHLARDGDAGRLDIGCFADTGWFVFDESAGYQVSIIDKAATRFLFELIAQLQAIGTVPMLDMRAYAAQI